MLHTVTFGSEEGATMIIRNLPEKYPMELNRSDMLTLVMALQACWLSESVYRDMAGDFLATIAETLDIEYI